MEAADSRHSGQGAGLRPPQGVAGACGEGAIPLQAGNAGVGRCFGDSGTAAGPIDVDWGLTVSAISFGRSLGSNSAYSIADFFGGDAGGAAVVAYRDVSPKPQALLGEDFPTVWH